jgi:hypothetical protein
MQYCNARRSCTIKEIVGQEMQRRELIFGFLAAGPLFAAESAARKRLTMVEEDAAPAGWVNFSLKEVNALAAETVAREFPVGITNTNVELGNNTAIGSARIDFAKVREASTGEAPGALGRLLLGGEKDVSVEATFRSAEGMCTIDPQRVVVSGLEIRGRVLDWLIENYLLPLYPTAKIGTPFELGLHIEHVEITPARVRLHIVR